MEKNYNGVHWDTEDLLSCKSAVRILLFRGVSLKTLRTLDFGNLWLESVLEELR